MTETVSEKLTRLLEKTDMSDFVKKAREMINKGGPKTHAQNERNPSG